MSTLDSEANTLPVTYGWYRDETAWLAGLSAAALGAAASQLEKLLDFDGACRGLLLAGLLLFLAAFVLAAFSYFWIVAVANRTEAEALLTPADPAPAAVIPKDDQATNARPASGSGSPKEQAEANRQELQRAKSWFERLHTPMLWAFFLAVLATALAIGCALAGGRSGGPYSLHSVIYTDPTCRCSRHLVVRIDTKSGDASVLTESSGNWGWTPVANTIGK